MEPQLMDTYGPDWIVRRRRRRRERVQRYVWRLTLPHPTARQELVELLRRRFPHFAIDQIPADDQP
jgi:hypothetical protein